MARGGCPPARINRVMCIFSFLLSVKTLKIVSFYKVKHCGCDFICYYFFFFIKLYVELSAVFKYLKTKYIVGLNIISGFLD